MPRVIVIGAGVAGLGAAYTLQKAGLEVEVLEAEPHVGGRMRSMEWNGAYIDLGAEFIADVGFPDALFHELDIMKDRLVYPGGKVAFDVWRDGGAHRFDYTDPAGILRYTGMSRLEKARLASLLPALARQWWESRGAPYGETWHGAWADDESVETWLSRRAPAFLEYVVEPMFELYCGWEPHNFSRGAFLVTAFFPRPPQIYTFTRGLGTVTQALADRLDVTTGARVTLVDLERDPVVVEWDDNGTPRRGEAELVLIAVPGSRVLDFTRGLDARRQSFFELVEYVPHELPFFTVTEPPVGVPESVFYPRNEDREVAAIGYAQSTTNPDVDFFRVSMKTRFIRRYLDRPDHEELDAIVAAAARWYPQITPLVKDRFVSRWREALPLFGVGSMRRIRDFMALRPQRGVAFAGDYLATGSTGAAYTTGQWAAADALARL
jgi:oxygen-dependent protoporphyrinogen oxidase